MKKAPVIILEGTWWREHEVPQILPFFTALETSLNEIELSHRTFRSLEDIRYYISKIAKGTGAFLYFACHGENLNLSPVDGVKISHKDILESLQSAKKGAVDFIHFGCCEMVPKDRRASFEQLMGACDAKWISGYSKEVDWLPSTFLDLALVSEVFVPQYNNSKNSKTDGRSRPLRKNGSEFVNNYNELARKLGFSAISKVSKGKIILFPSRLS